MVLTLRCTIQTLFLFISGMAALLLPAERFSPCGASIRDGLDKYSDKNKLRSDHLVQTEPTLCIPKVTLSKKYYIVY